jgi:hypothetical protein
MADDKKLRVGIDNSAFEAYESKMRQSSENLARDMIRSSRSYTTSAKETLTAIEEQIRAIEKRNALDREFREREVSTAREGGEITAPQARARMIGIAQESKEDKLQTQLLRELIDTVKSSSRQEIREDRIGVERRIAASRTVNQLAPEGDELSLLRESIQQQYLSELGGEEAAQRGFTGEGFRQYGMLPVQFAGARNMLDVAGGAAQTTGGLLGKMGGTGGIIGMIAALTVGKLIQTVGGSAENLESQLADWSRLGGGDVRSYNVSGYNVRGLARHGMDISDFVRNRAQLEIMSKTKDFGESAANLMYLSGGTMLSQQDVAGMVGLRRFGGGTASGTASYFEQYLKQTGQSMAVLPEIVQQFTNEARNIISQTGRIDTANLANIITTIGGQTGFQGDLLGTAVSTLGRGMQRSNNPVIQALQFRAARGAAGEGSTLWDIEKIMADPLSNPQYIQSMLASLREVSGGGQGYERAIANVLGINPNLAASFANIDLSKKLTEEQLIQLKEGNISFAGKDSKAIGAIQQGAKFLEAGRQKIGFEAAEDISNAMMDMVEAVNDLKNSISQQGMDEINENVDELTEAARVLANGETPFMEKFIAAIELLARSYSTSSPLGTTFVNRLFKD